MRPETRPSQTGGFTLYEMMLVVLVVAIIAAALVPVVGNNLKSSRLKTAANMLAADIDFCMSECINRPDTPRAIVFDTVANTYKMIDTTTNATITDPGDGLPFLNDFATGRTTQVAGVTITSVTMNGLPFTTLTFDSYGRPLITADMLITLSYAGKTMTVTVKQTTGDVTIQ